MKVIIKRILKVIVIIIVVMVVIVASFALFVVFDKYRYRMPDEKINEVAYDAVRGKALLDVTYVERKVTSNENDTKCYDIYVLSAWRTLQTCRIENGLLLNFRSLNSRDLSDNEGDEVYCAGEALNQLPNILRPDMKPSPCSEDNPIITIVKLIDPSPHPDSMLVPDMGNAIAWADGWWVQKWIGTSNEVPAVVESFCQLMMQPEATCSEIVMSFFFDIGVKSPRTAWAAAALPDIRNYPAYLRAIPLMTETEIAAAKDIPLVDLEKTRLNVHYAVKYPYVFFPIPPKRSPFPTLKKYTSGDKVKVIYRGECFLIETFINGSIEKNNGKGK